MGFELTEGLAVLLGSVIGALSAIAGTYLGSRAERKGIEQREARKYFVDEVLDKFISKLNYELIAVVALLKTSEQFAAGEAAGLLSESTLSPVLPFSDVHLHRLNQLHPALFTASITVIEALVNLKMLVRQVLLVREEPTISSERKRNLDADIQRQKAFIEHMIVQFGLISSELHKSHFTANRIQKVIKQDSFRRGLLELEAESQRLLQGASKEES